MGAEVGLAALAAGTLMTAYGQYQAGQSAKEIAARNQAVSNADAMATLQQTEETATNQREKLKRIMAAGNVWEAKSGFAPSETTQQQADYTLSQGEKDIAAIYAQGLNAASRLRSQGQIYTEQGEAAARGGVYGAGGTLLTGVGNVIDPRARYRFG